MTTRHWSTRTETPTDIPAVRQIVLAAFDTPEEADLVDALRADSAWLPGLSMVATDPSDTPVAHALLTRCHIGDTPALCLAPVAVLPQHQSTGAGHAVTTALLHAAAEQGEQFVVVLGHPHYYPRFGFRNALAHGIRLSIDIPADALMALSLTGAPLPTGTVRYAPPFGI
ncbi:N-acetyltransferase [Nocardia yamanashiensis]|uniref:GNAT family N-acetyltransferase n=1 Tax=Nocardia yamanashiensis TaxID=209247 RepID=UPI001E44C279|nr:N-acetyltransferase [Nocardia yamanashiensis]UGT43919.1 N-acetyltransferase [Nocardia yamanashiensis]